ncbi:MAG TPA: hypothetical protein VK541_11820 [Pedobacter sp.]|uniref:hypothetical protein n=1 Tax=Pedobacter sp. TaxID=1411316 RepID=UPI002CECCFBA|nr:hypothetical protein [Pedobacter sp.]HMI03165.1 hypothetical protein [Pedobacter sp.]
MQDKLEFKKTREFGDIIGDTFLFIRQNFKPFLKVYLYLCGFFILAGLLSGIVHLLTVKTDFSGVNSARPLENLFSMSYLMVIVFTFATYTAISVSTLSYISLYIEKGNVAPAVEEVWSYFKYFFLRVFGSSILISLMMMICFICCFIPGIYVFPAFSLFYSVMVFENGSFGYSFSRSFKLANSHWWPTAGAILILWIITYATMLVPSVPAMIIGMASAFTKTPGAVSITFLIVSTLIQYLCQVFLVLPVIGVSLCYFNLAERMENGGLLNRIEQLGTQKDQFSAPEEY